MEYREMTLPQVEIIGMAGEGDAGVGAQWIAALWNAANARFGEIAGLAKMDESGTPQRLWGAMSDVDSQFRPWGRRGLYLAGCEVESGSAAPEGWTKWTLPAFTYWTAPCEQTTYGEVFRQMLDDVLPKGGKRLAGAVQEMYLPAEGNGGQMYLCFPVEKH